MEEGVPFISMPANLSCCYIEARRGKHRRNRRVRTIYRIPAHHSGISQRGFPPCISSALKKHEDKTTLVRSLSTSLTQRPRRKGTQRNGGRRAIYLNACEPLCCYIEARRRKAQAKQSSAYDLSN